MFKQKVALMSVIFFEICLLFIFYISSRDGDFLNGNVWSGVLLFFSWVLIPIMSYSWAASFYLLCKGQKKFVKLAAIGLLVIPSWVIYQYLVNFDSLINFYRNFF